MVRVFERPQLLKQQFLLLAAHLHLCRGLLLLRNLITNEKSVTVAFLTDQFVTASLEQTQRNENIQCIVDAALDVQFSFLLASDRCTWDYSY